jgi:hypothetical protein
MFCAALYMSPNVITFERKLKKIDEVLSYVGGLFGIVGIVLMFILAKYN